MQNFHDGPPGEDKETEATMNTELTSTEDIQPLSVQEPPQNSDICQLIRKECCVEVREEQEVKNIVEQSAERGSRSIQTLKNFKVVHKSSISSNTSQIYSIHSIAPILSTKEPEHLLSMGYEHLNITPETEFDEVTKSNVENLLPIPSKCEIEASLSDPENVSIEGENGVKEENVVQQEEEEVNFKDISQIQDVVLREKLLSIIRLISKIESLNDNSTLDRVFNSFESDNSLLDNFSPEFETFCGHSEEARSGNTTQANYSLPKYDSFCFEIEPSQERLINLVKNDISDLSNDPFLEEVDLFLFDDSTPSVIKNIADNPKGDIRFLEELLINDSILSHESFVSNFEDNPSILKILLIAKAGRLVSLAAYNIVPYKLLHLPVGNRCHRLSFYSLREVIHGDYQELDLPRPFQKGACYVDSSLIERPRSRDWGQRLMGMPCDGAVYLTVAAFSYHVTCILMHCRPVIPKPYSFGYYRSRSCVHTTRPFMDFPHDVICLEWSYTS
uniref:Uncharacterized protein n=1 Tax=Tanacetum cinerariifolium TaxID=118510 RepID=A0A6L2NZ27_TANCI|nr:hypothetical protein [Tanacetum cinerariifolium]